MVNWRRSTNTHLGNSFSLREINSRVSKGIGLPYCLRKSRQLEKVGEPELDKGIVLKVIMITVITIKIIIFTRRQAYAVSRART